MWGVGVEIQGGRGTRGCDACHIYCCFVVRTILLDGSCFYVSRTIAFCSQRPMLTQISVCSRTGRFTYHHGTSSVMINNVEEFCCFAYGDSYRISAHADKHSERPLSEYRQNLMTIDHWIYLHRRIWWDQRISNISNGSKGFRLYTGTRRFSGVTSRNDSAVEPFESV